MTLKLPFLRSASLRGHSPGHGVGTLAAGAQPGHLARPISDQLHAQIQVHIHVQPLARFRAPPLDVRPAVPQTGYFPAATATRVHRR